MIRVIKKKSQPLLPLSKIIQRCEQIAEPHFFYHSVTYCGEDLRQNGAKKMLHTCRFSPIQLALSCSRENKQKLLGRYKDVGRVKYSVCVEGLNVVNDPKFNKVLNVITFCPKCNKVLNVITICPKCNKL